MNIFKRKSNYLNNLLYICIRKWILYDLVAD